MGKKRSQFKAHLQGLVDKVAKQSDLAKRLGVSESRIPEWMAGKRLPSPDTLIKLGRLALEYRLPGPFFFWALAGVDAETLEKMADEIAEGRYKVVGNTVPIPRFRETGHGREETGGPVPLPVEFVPNPRTTICLEVDEKSSGVVDGPKGLFILDTSVFGTSDVLAHQEQVVMVYMPGLPIGGHPKGIYLGRIRLQQRQHMGRPDWAWVGAMLVSLTEHQSFGMSIIWLGSYEEPEIMRGVRWEEADERDRRLAELWRRVGSNFPLTQGVQILGRVIGRLTGQIKK